MDNLTPRRSHRKRKEKHEIPFLEANRKRSVPKPKLKSNAERCREYREKIKRDPAKHQEHLEYDKLRKRNYRSQPKSEEKLDHERLLHKIRQRKYREQQRQSLAERPAPERLTRLDAQKLQELRKRNAVYSQKRRDSYTPQKRAAVNKKRRDRYHRQRLEKLTSTSTQTFFSCVQPESQTTVVDSPSPVELNVNPLSSTPIFHQEEPRAMTVDYSPHNTPPNTPDIGTWNTNSCEDAFSSKKALQKAVQRSKERIGYKGSKFVHVLRGLSNFAKKKYSSAKQVLASPEKIHLHTSIVKRLNHLKQKNDKISMLLKNEYINTLGEQYIKGKANILPQKMNPYENRKRNPEHQTASDFFEDIAVHLPTQRQRSRKEKRQKKIMTKTVQETFHRYKAKTDTKLSLRTFYRRRPRHIVSVTKTALRQCLCDRCQNPRYKLQALKPFFQGMSTELGLSDMQKVCAETLCAKTSEFHPLLCLDRLCNSCGVGQLQLKLKTALQPKLLVEMNWFQWEQVTVNKVKKTMKIKKCGSVETLIDLLCDDLQMYPRHVFNDQWQRTQISQLQKDIPKDTCLITMDFSENYSCINQDEVQSAHWGYKQVTIHPAVVQYNCRECASHSCNHNYVFLSDDLQHDSHFVDVVMKTIMFKLRDFNFKRFVFISDGCTGQYKSKLPFAYLNIASDHFPGVTLEKVFYGARHGKNACDGLGGVVKNLVRRAVASDPSLNIQDAKALFNYCSSSLCQCKFKSGSDCLLSLRSFILIDQREINRSIIQSNMLKTIPGTRHMHQIRSVKKGMIALRKNSCFCESCSSSLNDCPLNNYPGTWQIVKLSLPNVPLKAKVQDDVMKEKFTREVFFQNFHTALCAAKSFDDFQVICFENFQSVSSHDFVLRNYAISDLKCTIDQMAVQLVPRDVPSNIFPVNVVADGNCLPRAISLLVFGHEDFHVEVRCRLCMEMCLHKEKYLNIKSWSKGTEADNVETLQVLRFTSAECVSSDLDDIFKREVLYSIKAGNFLGLWEIFATAAILKCPVRSIFPDRGWDLYRKICNRIIYPPQIYASDRAPVSLMWSTMTNLNSNDFDDEHWSPNHFVTLLRISHSNAVIDESLNSTDCHDASSDFLNNGFISNGDQSQYENDTDTSVNGVMPEIGSHYLIRWNNEIYVSEILETDFDTQLAHVKFMEKTGSGTHYFWGKLDSSWEPVDCIVSKIRLELDSLKSNNRKQLYNVLLE